VMHSCNWRSAVLFLFIGLFGSVARRNPEQLAFSVDRRNLIWRLIRPEEW
jgi:hypothetical protein